jgi:hypothetical protein
MQQRPLNRTTATCLSILFLINTLLASCRQGLHDGQFHAETTPSITTELVTDIHDGFRYYFQSITPECNPVQDLFSHTNHEISIHVSIHRIFDSRALRILKAHASNKVSFVNFIYRPSFGPSDSDPSTVA